jgi:hypothetical protein
LKEREMPKGKLFEYAVIHHPKPTKDAAGNETAGKSKLVTDLKRELATEPGEVSILAARSIPEEYLDKLEEIEIVVRSF